MPTVSIIQVLLLSFHAFLKESKELKQIHLLVVGQRYYLLYPQYSILGPLLFYAYVCDLFFEVRDLEYASFADDTIPYICLPEMIPISEKLKKGIQSMFDWFSENLLKANG